MKKYFKNYLVIWIIFFAFFNLTAFIIPSPEETVKYTGSFWVGYIVVAVSLIGQLLCTYRMLSKSTTKEKHFLNMPVFTLSLSGLLISCIICAACMIISPLPYWIGAVAGAAVLALFAMMIVSVSTAAEAVEEVENKVKTDTSFMKALVTEAKTMMDGVSAPEVKGACSKVYEALLYSDPVSCDALADDEAEIKGKLIELKKAVNSGEDIAEKTDMLVKLIAARNEKCSLSKQ